MSVFSWLMRSRNSRRSLCIPADRRTDRVNWAILKGKAFFRAGGTAMAAAAAAGGGGLAEWAERAALRRAGGRRAGAGAAAVRVLRAGLDRGLAGSGDVAGAA